ncbi:MAG: PAS domain-containing protein [Rhodospirillaceae bacterium]|nr:PAS domain-containing protein [Rhodospirillaceae bacterium]MBT5192056.1 PAS domain-containing protein [Rhodospirillaceae bacterium]MBT5899267.1 PAS domain-containing protein [Rhodospirillaceae bacterium]MBT6429684.1 PAS domain-containing protein [Rhodospirillaceae bacterium]
MKTTDLVAFASDPAFAVNGDMRVVAWNAAAETLLGYSAAEAVGQRCGHVLQAFYPTGEPLCSILCEGRACMGMGHKWSLAACRIRHRSGDMVAAGISTLVLPVDARTEPDGDAVAVIFMRNISGEAEEIGAVTPLRIFTMGQFGLAIAGEGLNVEGWKRKQAAMVLKILVSHLGRPVHRERLIEWLWPDADATRGWERLKVTVSYLRGKLRAGGGVEDVIETVGQSYLLRRDAVWVDSDAFASLVTAGLEFLADDNLGEARARFEEAESLYRGNYLEDEPYAEWCAEEREHLREVHLELLAGMAKTYAAEGLYMEASRVCRTALYHDPCRESFLRALLENLVNFGRPDWAEAHYASWCRSLDDEYGLQPTDETLRVYRDLVAGRSAAAS